ncbi:hypothetical protein CC78DRAFT_583675 [Lojkania enalia]|uniref:lytic cellulose monooxygenase (C4-dehydrogenating) n=1 Tax=Lojkania enalia TaxID=147567 RepID=A0A9P4K534_9PLEO|nr:hypothetical protein CC78DRAFT_583675 [Didymosphaeria enalia]
MHILLPILILIFQPAASHYCFPYLLVNDTVSPLWKYVRRSLTPETASLVGTGGFPPMYNLHSEDIRCGRNSTGSGTENDVAVVLAGSTVGARMDFYPKSFCNGCGIKQIPYLHDGPLSAYLARSPKQSKSGLQTWEGDGEFFKIAERGPDGDTGWWTNILNSSVLFSELLTAAWKWNFTVPRTTPSGFYLLRVSSIYPKPTFNKTQYYASCVQIQVVGSEKNKTEPGPTVKFPGAFDEYDEGVLLPEGMIGHWSRYKMPGPSMWKG